METDLVMLASYGTLSEAYIARGKLEAAEIRCVIEDEHIVGNLWHIGNAVAGIKLKVARKDLDQAIAVLGEEIEITDEDWQTSEPEPEAETSSEPAVEPPPSAPLNAREQLIERAALTAMIGVAICPVSFFATVLLCEASFASEPIRDSHRFKLLLAIAINAPALLLLMAMLATLL
ncbi:MAG: putative signal transducing protein [Fimbriiglobus sp.]